MVQAIQYFPLNGVSGEAFIEKVNAAIQSFVDDRRESVSGLNLADGWLGEFGFFEFSVSDVNTEGNANICVEPGNGEVKFEVSFPSPKMNTDFWTKIEAAFGRPN